MMAKQKLLIFDLNKVLLARRPNSSNYIVRPHAIEFIHGMSEKYAIAVWTSMKRNTAKKMVNELFSGLHPNPSCASTIASSSSSSDSFLFCWYQPSCTPILPSEITTRGHSQQQQQQQQQKQEQPPLLLYQEHKASDSDESEQRPVYSKDLQKVWAAYPNYNEHSTILLDDSPEKCFANPPHTVVHPFPFAEENIDFDEELKPGGALWAFLMERDSPIRVDANKKRSRDADADADADDDVSVAQNSYVSPMIPVSLQQQQNETLISPTATTTTTAASAITSISPTSTPTSPQRRIYSPSRKTTFQT